MYVNRYFPILRYGKNLNKQIRTWFQASAGIRFKLIKKYERLVLKKIEEKSDKKSGKIKNDKQKSLPWGK